MAIHNYGAGGQVATKTDEFHVVDANVTLDAVNNEYDLKYDHITDDLDIACSLQWQDLPSYVNFSLHFDLTLGAGWAAPGQRVDLVGSNQDRGGIWSLRWETDGKVSMVMGANVDAAAWTPAAGNTYRVELRRDSTTDDKLYLKIDGSDQANLADDVGTATADIHFGELRKDAGGTDPAMTVTVTNIALRIYTNNELPIWFNDTSITTTGLAANGTNDDLESGRAVHGDLFTRSADSTLASHTPSQSGTGWTVLKQIGGGLLQVLEANDYVNVESGGDNDAALYTADATYPSADYYVNCQARVVGSGDDTTFLCGRITDADNYYAIEFTDAVFKLFKNVAGTFTQLGSDAGAVVVNLDTVELRMVGTTISAYSNGVKFISVTDSAHSSAGKAGYGVGSLRTAADDMNNQEMDNFYVYDLDTANRFENVDEVPGAAIDESFNLAGSPAATEKSSYDVTDTAPSGTIKGLTIFSRTSSVLNSKGQQSGISRKQLVREGSSEDISVNIEDGNSRLTVGGWNTLPLTGGAFTSQGIDDLEIGMSLVTSTLSTGDIGQNNQTPSIYFGADGTYDDPNWSQTGGTGTDAYTILNDNQLSTYVENNVVGTRQGVKVGPFNSGDLKDMVIAGVAMYANGQSSGGGTDGAFKMYFTDDGVTYYYSGDYTANGNNRRYRWGTNPSTGNAWTIEEVFDGEFGFEIVTAATTNVQYRLSQVEIWGVSKVKENSHWISIIHGDAPTTFEIGRSHGYIFGCLLLLLTGIIIMAL